MKVKTMRYKTYGDEHIDIEVGDPGPGLDLAVDIARCGGRINLFGWIKGEEAHFNPSTWHLKGLSIVNSSPAARQRDTFPAAIRFCSAALSICDRW